MNYNDYHPDDLRRIIKECHIALSRKEDRSTKFIKDNPKNFKIAIDDVGDVLFGERTSTNIYKEKDNYIFKATLSIESKETNGNGGTTYFFLDKQSKRYTMNKLALFNLLECIESGKVEVSPDGFTGLFTYSRNGREGQLNTVIYKGKEE